MAFLTLIIQFLTLIIQVLFIVFVTLFITVHYFSEKVIIASRFNESFRLIPVDFARYFIAFTIEGVITCLQTH